MERKHYKIGGKKFHLKEYGELTGFEEEKIDALLSGNGQITGYEIFPLILVSADQNGLSHLAEGETERENFPHLLKGGTEGGFDWRHLKNKQIIEILTDFIVEKKSSQDTMLSYMRELTGQKLQQLSNMKENSAEAEASGKMHL